MFPWSHTNVPSPDYFKHLSAARKLAGILETQTANHYMVGAVGIILCKYHVFSLEWSNPWQTPCRSCRILCLGL